MSIAGELNPEVLGRIVPELRKSIEREFRELATRLLESGVECWAARQWRRNSDEEADCTLQLHQCCQALTRSVPAFGLFHAELESLTPSDAIVDGREPAITSARPDIRITIVGSSVGVSVECKRLRHSATDFRNYATRGLHRFTTGQYGARDPFGLMVGYLQGCGVRRALDGINRAIERSPDFQDSEVLVFSGSTPALHRLFSAHERFRSPAFPVLHVFVEVGESVARSPGTSTTNEETRLPTLQQLWQPRFDWVPGEQAAQNSALIDSCVKLYNAHYGRWGPRTEHYGHPVRMPPALLRQLANSPQAFLALAYAGDELIGYCLALKLETERGVVSWVLQLVVHSTYRKARIATKLLFSVWQFSDGYCWGLATSNPYAVRALETATRRQCNPAMITSAGPLVLEALAQHVSYLPHELCWRSRSTRRPVVDTQFFVDHSESEKILRPGRVSGRRWRLGRLGEGEEWFACTFGSQPAEALSHLRVRELLKGSDEIWQSAYERMTLDESHVWRRYAEAEVDFCLTQANGEGRLQVTDVGCGDGRHARVIASHGHDVTAIDISMTLLQRAKAADRNADVTWITHDARQRLPVSDMDLIIALYDVLGSSADRGDDRRILQNCAAALRDGGVLVLSVMNAEVSLRDLPASQRPDSLAYFVESLERLPPSMTMEQSGSVFDPELLLYFEDTFYRKEQFEGGPGRLPAEYVVRDRRFFPEEVEMALTDAGFDVVCVFPSRLGHWSDGPPGDPSGKELVAVARARKAT